MNILKLPLAQDPLFLRKVYLIEQKVKKFTGSYWDSEENFVVFQNCIDGKKELAVLRNKYPDQDFRLICRIERLITEKDEVDGD